MGDDERKCLELAWWLMRETSEGQPGDRTLLAELFKDVADEFRAMLKEEAASCAQSQRR
jgi:hypothetical protein